MPSKKAVVKSEVVSETGDFRHLVYLQTINSPPVPDGAGGTIDTWTTVVTTWAQIKPLRGLELFNARQLQAQITHQITLWQSGIVIDASSRIVAVISGKIFNIAAVLRRDEMNAYYDVMAIEQTANR